MRFVVPACLLVLASCSHDWPTTEPRSDASTDAADDTGSGLDDGLILYLSLDDPSATTEPIGDRPITSNADASEGVAGGGLSFDGAQSLEVQLLSPLQVRTTYSLSLWYRLSDSSAEQAFVSCHGDPAFLMVIANARIQARAYEGFATNWPNYHTATAAPTNAWTHATMTVDGTDVRIYINGELEKEETLDAVPADISPFADSCYLGRSGYGGNNRLVGELDEIRIYDRALSAVEVRSLADNPVP